MKKSPPPASARMNSKETCGKNSSTESDAVGVHPVTSDIGNFLLPVTEPLKARVTFPAKANAMENSSQSRARREIPCAENKQEFRTHPREQEKTVCRVI